MLAGCRYGGTLDCGRADSHRLPGRFGVRPGFYYSVHENWLYNVSNFVAPGGPSSQSVFLDMALAQLAEIQAYYGDQLAQVWFDAGVKQTNASFLGAVNRWIGDFTSSTNATCHSCENMPSAAAVHWMGNEHAALGYPAWYANTPTCGHFNGIDPSTAPIDGPDGATRWCSPHCDAVLREHIWFWDQNPPPPKAPLALVRQYLTSVGRGCNMVMDLQPMRSGQLNNSDVSAYGAWGKALKALLGPSRGAEVAKTLSPPPAGINITWGPASRPVSYGALELCEDLAHGQTVQAAVAEYLPQGSSVWLPLPLSPATKSSGVNTLLSIGRRRIVVFRLPAPTAVQMFRVTVTRHLNATWAQQEGPDGGPREHRPDGTLPRFSSAAVYDWSQLQPASVGFDPQELLV